MHINPFLFILPRTPNQIVWNYKDHTQYQLDLNHSKRLAQLIEDPNHFDRHNTIDQQLLTAGILSLTEKDPTEWGWDELSKIYHIGTRDIPFDAPPENSLEWSKQYLKHCNEVLAKPSPETERMRHDINERIVLPSAGTLSHDSLANALLRRKTCRSFNDHVISLNDVSTLLYLSLGYLNEREPDRDECIARNLDARRSSPSAGGLNACEGFLWVRNVSDLAPGLYAYDPLEHALLRVGPLPDTALGQLLCGQHFINDLPLGLFITARFDRLWWKYEHSRAYRMAFVEAGHLSQTFQLVATALGLNTWLTGALVDRQVETLLQLHNSAEQPLFFVGCGQSDGQAMCQEMHDLLHEAQT